MELSRKQQMFVETYLTTWNATEAARQAGYRGNANTLAVTGHDLLRNPKIDAVIKARLQERAMGADEVLMRLAEHGRAEYSRYINEAGTVDLPAMIADGKGHLIKGVKETREGRQIEFYDAQAALALLGKNHKLFTEKVEHDVHGSIAVSADDIVAARQQALTAEAELLERMEAGGG